MPELPEVETVARDLRGLIVGATIVDAETRWDRTLRDTDPAAFADGVAGRRIEAVGRRGKQLVVELSGGAFLTIHLKMTGQLFVVPRGGNDDPYVRLVLELDDGREIRFRDIRKFGRVGLYGTGTADPFEKTGPEPLADAFTVRAFRHRLRARKGRLKSLLTDQSFVAGVGNIYADEALWAARLHPLRTARTLRPPDERRLWHHLRRILAEAVIRRGSSIDDYTAPDGDGEMQEHLEVYQRTDEPCRRCDRPIRRIVVGGRATHFCSWCQRLPSTDRAGAKAILATLSTPRRRGGRWTELAAGEGRVGLTRAERTRKAAATRRAAARGSAGG
ncbi:MAG TPA: bifunctional DNA-formamidopyrimidine glycosylase/DNA-(apurinic or apyrimidinic site) lyase [Candidatus Limnocylindrales bacterium]|nr:bifunctional DNA-formamidopyrimidine glycosylase/DNA-(apurinic or apyrimidinic site) lyase [Candidatus Limnocylindrales bacterium]